MTNVAITEGRPHSGPVPGAVLPPSRWQVPAALTLSRQLGHVLRPLTEASATAALALAGRQATRWAADLTAAGIAARAMTSRARQSVRLGNRAGRRLLARHGSARRLLAVACAAGIPLHDAERMTLRALIAALLTPGPAARLVGRPVMLALALLLARLALAATLAGPASPKSTLQPPGADPAVLARVLVAAPGAPNTAARHRLRCEPATP